MYQTDKILKSLEEKLNEAEEEALFLSKEESGLSADILTTRHRGFGSMSNTVEGRFYFLEDDEADHSIFCVKIAILSGMSNERMGLMAVEMAGINAGIPLGGYAFDPGSNSVCYTLRVPFVKTMKEKEAMEEADSVVALSLSVAAGYCKGILKLSGR